MQLKGREKQYYDNGKILIDKFCEEMSSVATLEAAMSKEDKKLSVMLTPRKFKS